MGEAAVRAAEPPEPVVPGGRVSAGSAGARMQELMGLRSELMEDRRVLRNIGGNLNDIARVANTDGVLESTVERVDRTVAEVDRQVNGAAAQLRRSGSRR
ncbi:MULTISPECIES: plasmid mobilization relaxosome protein MobC [unclassified Pseudonocardia]|uniref:plasmid mobilization relaxosome protein MobC n=1 Tax=unclassified Pseudonocardia TaxID=2619320 RepID=UPI0014833182|nr:MULTISPECIES: plasmid mobilization relaxosome protein MobC [unclassified Pseudonocardia]